MVVGFTIKKSFIAVRALATLLTLSIILTQHVCVAEQVHHKLGDDGGWDSSGRVFRVGDIIWITNTGKAKENVLELQSLGEFLDCDLTNPIRMYTQGVHRVSLDAQGSRFFASSNVESCKNGLKIHVDAQAPPKPTPQPSPPSEPSPPEPIVPEPDVPEPIVPEPDVPEPIVPEPDVPEPIVPEPDVPEPIVPEPDVPEPIVPEPDVPQPDEPSPPYEPEPEPDEPSGDTPPPSGSSSLRGEACFVLITALFFYLSF